MRGLDPFDRQPAGMESDAINGAQGQKAQRCCQDLLRNAGLSNREREIVVLGDL